MDQPTLDTYNQHGRRYAGKWLGKPMPDETAEAVRACFSPGLSTVDVGCGSGRDVAWLVEQGFPTVGIEASETMLDVAREAFPQHRFRADSLPRLSATSETFSQVLCRNVLMHLPAAAQIAAARRLAELMAHSMVLTWRIDTKEGESRDRDGRLYAHVDPAAIEQALQSAGVEVVNKRTASSGASGKTLAVWTVKR